MSKKYSDETKEKALQLYLEDELTVTEIADTMDIPRGTVAGWLKSYTGKNRSEGHKRKSRAMKEKYKLLRDEAYAEGLQQAPELLSDPKFRDFVAMYIGEGFKKTINDVAIVNSNPDIMLMAQHFMIKLSNPDNTIEYNIQLHIDQDEAAIKAFWGSYLNIDPAKIRTSRVSTTDQSTTRRKFNSKYGVLTIRVGDTYFRQRLEAWMNYLRKLWLDRFSE